MREILFRAKQVNNGEWVEGNYANLKWCNNIIHVVIPEGAEIDSGNTLYEAYEINPETLCQYTGMADKNGKRIWENDIVSCEHEKYLEDNPLEILPFSDPIKYKRNYSVEFINTGSSYGYRLRNKSIHFMLTGNVIYNHNIEILGNVFDNPELLKGD